jgi:hypothetical protein
MEKYSITDLGLFIGGVAASLSALLAVAFKSKCTHLKCCCVECSRPLEAIMKDLPAGKEPAAEREEQP